MDELKPGQHTGYIPVDPKPSDWIRGGETGITGALINSSGDWRPYLPAPKCQLMKVDGVSYGDTESCTNFSATNHLATYLNWLVKTNQIPAEALQFLKDNGYFDAAGLINLSPRFSALTSGTTPNGNNQPAVWDALRNVGIVPEQDCPAPVDQWRAKIQSGSWTVQDLWNIWFDKSAITPDAKRKATQFLKYFTIQYHWAAYPAAPGNPDIFRQDMLVAPLNIATAVCPGWNTDDPIKACGAGTQHATEMCEVELYAYDIFDHYNPYLKQFALDYDITYAMQGIAVVGISLPSPSPSYKHHFSKQLQAGMTDPEVVALQDALKADGDFPATVQSTGWFGPITQTAVQKFQAKYGIVSSGTPDTTGYGRVGPKTIAKLNELFDN